MQGNEVVNALLPSPKQVLDLIVDSERFVTSTAAPIATGWSDPVPGRVFHPAVVQCLSRRTANAFHENAGLCQVRL